MEAVRDAPVGAVFIRGIAQRSGTNYLRDLLLLHPQVVKAREPVWEDFCLDDATMLTAYVERLTSRWPASWGIDAPAMRQELRSALGAAARDVLLGHHDTTVVAKTPSTRGIELFPELFPDDVLVILVRDGRSVIESLRRSFGWSFDRALQEWRASAERIRSFTAAHPDQENRSWVIVRYEDILTTPVPVLDRIAAVAGLSTGQVTPEAAASLPVRGSSDVAAAAGAVHWRPVERDASFQPERRWAEWDRRSHARFNWVAGDLMEHFGYVVENPVPGGPVQRVGQHVSDVASQVAGVSRRGRPTVARLARAARILPPRGSG